MQNHFKPLNIMQEKPLVVKAPEGCKPNLTAGKEYKVIGYWANWDEELGYKFKIINDRGFESSCLERKCSHLNSQNWIVVKRENQY